LPPAFDRIDMIDVIVAHSQASSSQCRNTSASARIRTSGGWLVDLLVHPSMRSGEGACCPSWTGHSADWRAASREPPAWASPFAGVGAVRLFVAILNS
jgi:hypothetical protein